jgi:hypothetical protein
MNGPTRKKYYTMVAKRDGEYCRGCQVLSQEKPLVLDHINNNNRDNRPENFQLLCRHCNYMKNPRREPLDMCVNEWESGDMPAELQINRTKEPQFKQYLASEILENGQVSQKEIVNSSAELLDLSPITIGRYLDKVCSKAGVYERHRIGNTIVIRFKKELNLV